MSWVTIAWTAAGAAALTLGIMHLVVWLEEPRSLSNLVFAVSAIATAILSVCEMLAMRTHTTFGFARGIRWAHIPVFILFVSLVWFVRLYLDAGRPWLAWTVCGLRALALALNFAAPVNLDYTAITGIRTAPLLGETVSFPVGILNPWVMVGELGSLLFVVYLGDATLTVWRRGDRRRALVVGGSMTFFIAVIASHAALMDRGLLRVPYFISFAYLGIVVAMGYELSSDLLKAADLNRRLQASEAERRESERRMDLAVKSAEMEVQQQREELAHLSRVTMVSELSGSLAHELNQPLTSILSNAQAAQRLLNREPADLGEVREILKDIVDEDKRAGEVIHRLRLLLTKGEVTRQPLDLSEVARDVLKIVRSDLVNQGVAVGTELAPDLPTVKGDRVQLQQVLLNLVVNGCDAMAGVITAERRLLVRTEPGGGGVHVSVTDRGAGIPREKVSEIFEPFVTTKSNGLGLGLTVCRTIITAHGGTLWATNNPGRGATIHFTLPSAEERA